MTIGNKRVTLEDAVTAIKEEAIDARLESQSAERVRSVLGAEDAARPGALHGCADVVALIPSYRRQELGEARRLLVEDHARECLACRERLEQPLPARVLTLPWSRPIERARAARPGFRTWAVAASLILVVTLGLLLQRLFGLAPGGGVLLVQSVTGELLRVSETSQKPLAPGAAVLASERVRSGGGGQAVVRLVDGSLVEMGERAQLAVEVRGADTTILLDRGNILVEAAKRSRGHLYVAAGSTRVSVTGTVFSVSRGISGARVSVIEGEVHVADAGHESVLHPGEQVWAGTGLAPVAVRDDIAWSRKRDDHLKLMAGLAGLQRDLERVHLPGLRYGSRLMSLASPETVIYVAAPNYGEALAEANEMLTARLAAAGPFRDAWLRSVGKAGDEAKLTEAVAKLRELGSYLGDEIVFTVGRAPGRNDGEPLLLAEVRRPGIESFLTQELFPSRPGHGGLRLRVVDAEGLAALGDVEPKDEAFVLVQDDVLAVAPQPRTLRAFVARLSGGRGFGAGDFAERVAQVYREGAGVLFAIDLEHAGPHDATREAAQDSSTVRHLILERKDVDGQGQHRGELTFDGPRKGVAGWLSAPAPMGALSFVSSSAGAAAVFLHKDPVAMLEELIAMGRHGSGSRGLADLEQKLGLRLREDVASALGGEMALALDGPLLPQPAWRLILEVRDADRLASALATLVDVANLQAAEHGKPGLRLEHEQVGERTYHTLHGVDAVVPLEVHYTFVDGYLVAAPSRAMLMRSLDAHASGQTLAESASFRALLPKDSEPYCSAILFQNLTTVVAPLVQTFGVGPADSGAVRALAQAAADARPTLFALYAEEDRIRLAGTGAPLGLDVGTLALPSLLQQAWPGARAARRP